MNLEVAITELNSAEWVMSYQVRDGEHLLIFGDVLLATFDSVETMHAFVAGMAVHQASLPDEVLAHIRDLFAE